MMYGYRYTLYYFSTQWFHSFEPKSFCKKYIVLLAAWRRGPFHDVCRGKSRLQSYYLCSSATDFICLNIPVWHFPVYPMAFWTIAWVRNTCPIFFLFPLNTFRIYSFHRDNCSCNVSNRRSYGGARTWRQNERNHTVGDHLVICNYEPTERTKVRVTDL